MMLGLDFKSTSFSMRSEEFASDHKIKFPRNI